MEHSTSLSRSQDLWNILIRPMFSAEVKAAVIFLEKLVVCFS